MAQQTGRRSTQGGESLSERQIQTEILLRCGRGDTRLFRQNVGLGWVGKSKRFDRRETVVIEPGDVLVRNARPLHAGLCEGSSDLIGWHAVEVTPDMVGQRVALFTSFEVKTETGRPTPEQLKFLDAVRNAGGIACVARSVEDAERALVVGD